MKICLINNLYAPYSKGGAERVLENIASALKKEHKVFVVSTKPHSKFSIFNFQFSINEIDNLINYQIPSLYYNLNKIPVVFRLFWHVWDMFDLVSYYRVYRIIKKEKPDIVMTHNLKGVSFLIPRLLQCLKIKHIHTLHDIQLIHPSGLMFYGEEKKVDGLFAKIYQSACRLLFGSPNLVVSPSSWLLQMHTDRGFFKDSEKKVIQNPISVILNASEESNLPLLDKERAGVRWVGSFLYVGQIERHKGVELLINAFKKLEGDYGLLIVGPGSMLEELKENTKDARIKFLGSKSKEEVRELMQKADCLVVPSLCYENSPTVIYEAFANNLPVIASDLGGIPELLDENCLFKPEEDELLQKLKDF
ncbi:MAG: glycosyltransferase family 4 protein, partial [Patescibacteria group bacterium]